MQYGYSKQYAGEGGGWSKNVMGLNIKSTCRAAERQEFVIMNHSVLTSTSGAPQFYVAWRSPPSDRIHPVHR